MTSCKGICKCCIKWCSGIVNMWLSHQPISINNINLLFSQPAASHQFIKRKLHTAYYLNYMLSNGNHANVADIMCKLDLPKLDLGKSNAESKTCSRKWCLCVIWSLYWWYHCPVRGVRWAGGGSNAWLEEPQAPALSSVTSVPWCPDITALTLWTQNGSHDFAQQRWTFCGGNGGDSCCYCNHAQHLLPATAHSRAEQPES